MLMPVFKPLATNFADGEPNWKRIPLQASQGPHFESKLSYQSPPSSDPAQASIHSTSFLAQKSPPPSPLPLYPPLQIFSPTLPIDLDNAPWPIFFSLISWRWNRCSVIRCSEWATLAAAWDWLIWCWKFIEFIIFHSMLCFELIESFQEGAALTLGDGEADAEAGNLGEVVRSWGGFWRHILMEVAERRDVGKFVAGKEGFF